MNMEIVDCTPEMDILALRRELDLAVDAFLQGGDTVPLNDLMKRNILLLKRSTGDYTRVNELHFHSNGSGLTASSGKSHKMLDKSKIRKYLDVGHTRYSDFSKVALQFMNFSLANYANFYYRGFLVEVSVDSLIISDKSSVGQLIFKIDEKKYAVGYDYNKNELIVQRDGENPFLGRIKAADQENFANLIAFFNEMIQRAREAAQQSRGTTEDRIESIRYQLNCLFKAMK